MNTKQQFQDAFNALITEAQQMKTLYLAALLGSLSLAAVDCSAGGTHHLTLVRDYVSGRNRMCVYDDLGHDYVVTIGAERFCERVIEKEGD